MSNKKFRIATKLWISAGVLVGAMLGITLFGALRFAAAQTEGEAAVKAVSTRVEAATRWSGLTEANAARTCALVLSNEATVEAAFKDVIAATTAQISEVQKSIGGMTL